MPISSSMAAITIKRDSAAELAADTMMHSEYLPMLANSVTKNPAQKEFSSRHVSGRVTEERFASNDKFEAYGAKTQPRFGRANKTDVHTSNY